MTSVQKRWGCGWGSPGGEEGGCFAAAADTVDG